MRLIRFSITRFNPKKKKNLYIYIYIYIHFTDCEEAFSPAGTKNSCKYRNEILIMDNAKTTTTKKQTSKRRNKQTSNKLK